MQKMVILWRCWLSSTLYNALWYRYSAWQQRMLAASHGSRARCLGAYLDCANLARPSAATLGGSPRLWIRDTIVSASLGNTLSRTPSVAMTTTSPFLTSSSKSCKESNSVDWGAGKTVLHVGEGVILVAAKLIMLNASVTKNIWITACWSQKSIILVCVQNCKPEWLDGR